MVDSSFRDKLVSLIKERRLARKELELQLLKTQKQLAVVECELAEFECALSAYDRLMDSSACERKGGEYE